MLENTETTGSITSSKVDKERFARESWRHNSNNAKFRELFPEYVKEGADPIAERPVVRKTPVPETGSGISVFKAAFYGVLAFVVYLLVLKINQKLV